MQDKNEAVVTKQGIDAVTNMDKPLARKLLASMIPGSHPQLRRNIDMLCRCGVGAFALLLIQFIRA